MKRAGPPARHTPLRATKPLERHTDLRRTTRPSGVKGKSAGGGASDPARGLARSRSTGPDRLTVDAVLERDQHSCARCGCAIHGDRGVGWSIHHRRPRQMGGSQRPDTNLPSNLVLLCVDCHGYIESHRLQAIGAGFLLSAQAVPSKRRINHAEHGWVLLTDDCRVIPIND